MGSSRSGRNNTATNQAAYRTAATTSAADLSTAEARETGSANDWFGDIDWTAIPDQSFQSQLALAEITQQQKAYNLSLIHI